MAIARIVACDPGYRNLAWVTMDYNIEDKKLYYVTGARVDVGKCSSQVEILSKVWNYVTREGIFVGATYVVIEDQVMGPRTNAHNTGISWTLACAALNQPAPPSVEFMSPRKKFSVFKKYLDEHKDKKVKERSVLLARSLLKSADIDDAEVFKPKCASHWDHLADAVGLVFVKVHDLWA